jgi:fructokinase
MANNPKPLVMGVGELLWDLLPSGKQPGGAPANFAYHAQELGAESLLMSRVGNDPLGREILGHFAGLGLRTDGISADPTVPTGTAAVSLDQQGKPSYTILEPSAWDFIEARENNLRQAAQAEAVCFGSLAQRHPAARAAITAVIAATPSSALRIFDVNLRQNYWSPELIRRSVELANVLKLNVEELPLVAAALGVTADESSALRQLADRFQLRAVALTKGAMGSVLLAGDTMVSLGVSSQAVVDTVGAGDAFTAALAMGLLRGCDLAEIQRVATEVAGYVCSCPGATPALPGLLRSAFASVCGTGEGELLYHEEPGSAHYIC